MEPEFRFLRKEGCCLAGACASEKALGGWLWEMEADPAVAVGRDGVRLLGGTGKNSK